MERPGVRREAVLDGIFSDGVVLVESEGDRTVYQAAFEATQSDTRRLDVLFIAMGGTGSFGEVVSFFRKLKIPVSIIADLDFLLEKANIERVLDSMDESGDIARRVEAVGGQINSKKPVLSPKQFREQLQDILDGQEFGCDRDGWGGQEHKLIDKLRRLAKELTPSTRPKSGGVDVLRADPGLHGEVVGLLADLKRQGIFLVPVGELEQWQPVDSEGAPGKSAKGEWASWAAEQVFEHPGQWSDLTKFVGEVVYFLERASGRYSRDGSES
jgi:hypothetical protein